MTVYNAFYFLNELDLLEIRFRELYDVVDVFVIVEGTRTYRGEPKEPVFYNNRKRFEPWLDKVRHYVVTDYPYDAKTSLRATWAREYHQRDCLRRVLPEVRPDDCVVLTDGDEIPRASVVRRYDASQGVVKLDMRFYHFWLNYKANNGWDLAHVIPGIVYNAFLPSELRMVDVHHMPHLPFNVDGVYTDAGWHFAYLGGAEAIRYKLRNYSHWNLQHSLPTLAALQRGQDVSLDRLGVQSDGRRYVFAKTPIDAGHPACVQQDQAVYRERGLVLA